MITDNLCLLYVPGVWQLNKWQHVADHAWLLGNMDLGIKRNFCIVSACCVWSCLTCDGFTLSKTAGVCKQVKTEWEAGLGQRGDAYTCWDLSDSAAKRGSLAETEPAVPETESRTVTTLSAPPTTKSKQWFTAETHAEHANSTAIWGLNWLNRILHRMHCQVRQKRSYDANKASGYIQHGNTTVYKYPIQLKKFFFFFFMLSKVSKDVLRLLKHVRIKS